MQEHPFIFGIGITLLLLGLPAMIFPDADKWVVWLAVFVEIAIIVLFVNIATKINQPTEDEIKKQENSYTNLLAKYNVPANHYKAVIHYSYKYELYYAPVVMWKINDIVKMLVVNNSPRIIETKISDFSSVYTNRLSKIDKHKHREDQWYALPEYIRNQFCLYMNHYNIYDSKNRDLTYGTYMCGNFDFCTNSLHSLFSMLDKPISFYQFDFLTKNFLISKLPMKCRLSEKEMLINKALSKDSYLLIQEELYSLKEKGIITHDEVINALEKARINKCNR